MITIDSGFNIAADLHHRACVSGEICEKEHDLDVYRCDNDGCPGFSANDTAASLTCKENHQGLLCGACLPDFFIAGKVCKHCGEISKG